MADHQNSAVIEITRERQWFALMAFGWRAFIDGIWVGNVGQRGIARFQVQPGSHVVKVWSHRGAQDSNEMVVTARPGETIRLRCSIDAPPTGISRLSQQVDVVKQSVTDGIVRTIHLREEKQPEQSEPAP